MNKDNIEVKYLKLINGESLVVSSNDAVLQYKEYIKDAVEIEFMEQEEEKKILESEDDPYGEGTEGTERPKKIIH